MGGVIRRDEHGNPNGVLEEPPAREPVFRHIPAPTEADWMEGIKAACAAYTAKGVTTAQDGFTATGDWGALKRAHPPARRRSGPAVEPNGGAGTRRLRRKKPTAFSTEPFSLPE